MRAGPFVATFLVLQAAAASVHAEPEWNVAAQTSLCGLGTDQLWQKTGFCGGFRGDL